jgi:hypothetical protein
MFNPSKLIVYSAGEGDSGGGGGVTSLPEVPSPSDSDLDTLSGGEDDSEAQEEPSGGDVSGRKPLSRRETEDETPEEEAPEEGTKPKSRLPPEEGEKPDIDEGEEEPEKDKVAKAKEEPEQPLDRIPSIKALKESYPDIFKKFPHVRTAIAEHQQFKNVFASVVEAQEAAQTQTDFYSLSDALMERGDFGTLLDEIERADKDAVPRLVKNVLPALLERNRDLYLDVTEQPIKMFVKAAYDRARAENNQNLLNSAQYLWKFLTGRFEAPNVQEKVDPNEQILNQRIQSFEINKFREARKGVDDDIGAQMFPIIAHTIDPNQTVPEYTRNSLVNSILSEIDGIIANDEAHMNRVNRLWAQARRSSYARQHVSRITSTYLERAKQVLPKIAQKVREEHNIQIESKKNPQREEREAQSGHRPPARPPSQGAPPHQRTLRETNPRNIDWKKTSDEDVLGGKAYLKRR